MTYPQPTQFLSATQRKLGEVVLSHDRQFIVPLNQRPWAWKDTRDVQHLLDDFKNILEAFFDPDASPKWKRRPSVTRPPHFFGTFVFYKKTCNEFEIFDGQQRLTAILMLCAVLRETANELKNESGPHQSDASDIYGGFNEWLQISPANATPRLVPNKFFEELFKGLIFDPLDNVSRQSKIKTLPSHVHDHVITKKLIKSFNHIRRWVRKKIEESLTPTERTDFLRVSYDVLRELFCCVETLIYDEQYSYEVFGCLNARGEKLSAADLIKNDVFTVADKTLHHDISGKWNRIGENVPDQDISEFLRRRHIGLIGACKKADTHSQIKKEEIEKNSATITALVEDWYKDSFVVRKIAVRDANFAKRETLERLEIILDVLNVGLAYIPLLVASKTFLPHNKDDFHKCVCLVEKFVFRKLTIVRMDTPDLERKLGEAARILYNNGSLHEFRDYIKGQIDDVAFERQFSKHAERRVKVQYYILRELETHLLGGGRGVIPGNHHHAKNHVEHVLPKRLSNAKGRKHEWSWARDPEEHKNLVNRLGNLLILESDINREVGNHEFGVKQRGKYKKPNGNISNIKSFKDSTLKWPQNLSDVSKWMEWTGADINKRQKQMARDALNIWAI